MADDTQQLQQQPMLPKHHLQPTTSRLLQGLIDLALLLVGLLLYLVVRLFRLVMQLSGLEGKYNLAARSRNMVLNSRSIRKKTSTLSSSLKSTSKAVEFLEGPGGAGAAGPIAEAVEDDSDGSDMADAGSEDNEDGELEAALAACRSGVLSMFVTMESEKEVWVTGDGSSHTAREVLLMLKGCHGAYLHCLKHLALVEEDIHSNKLQQQVAQIISSLLSDSKRNYSAAAQRIRSTYQSAIQLAASRATHYDKSLDGKYVLREFQYLLLLHRTRHMPSRMLRVVLPLQGGGFLEEGCDALDMSLAVEYLGALGGRYREYVEFMEQFKGIRPSGAKKQTQVQAMVMNGRFHFARVDKDGGVQEVYGDVRCGAFTLHGRQPKRVGLAQLQDTLQACEALEPAAADEVAKKLKFASLEHLKQEVAEREVLLTAQALVVLSAALSVLLQSPSSLEAAWRSGSFLILQQSLLSDLHANERAMLQDMQGVLRKLNKRLRVRFELGTPANVLELSQEHITLCYDVNKLPALRDMELQAESFTLLCSPREFAQRTYGITWLLANQGVNVWQSLGFLFCGDRAKLLQDQLNEDAFNGLLEYGAKAGREARLEPLRHHYSAEGFREVKDMEGVRRMREAVTELGGVRVVNCKSGKDRTAMEVANSMAWETVRRGYAPSGSEHYIHDKFVSGLSYAMTSQNNAMPNAYAFTEPELMTLPSGWGPDWKLCGNVES